MKNKPVVKFLLRLFCFFVVLTVLDGVVGYMLRKIYFSQRVGQYSQTTYAIDSARQDIMIFGSSRAVRHYSPAIISKISGLSCYDSGRDGLMIPYSTAMEEIALTRHTPRLIILDITPRELGIDETKYVRLSILLPYCAQHKQFVKYIQEISPLEPYKLLSRTYPFNSSVFILATNALFSKSIKKDTNGYLPLEGHMTKTEMDDYNARMQKRYLKIKVRKEVAEDKAVGYFKTFLNNTVSHNIKTIVVISPTILKDPFYLDNQTVEKKLIIQIAAQYPNVTFLDYSADPRFNYHPEKFMDVFHLNKIGSEEFSYGIAHYIKDTLLKK
ncbi:hypothetical protein [Mucilaginibacter sp. FT3.2]|uniref:hypothetical protein n=1 Tax=Mucilaginibacter sp. FT3.2 TaxID=2723090 RepID=UPI00160D96FB|nr:hypothetical protein [Mucilaginibacter sp. FT3.2]MBB6233399.1 hypothetical protein [Mucilaginibacter sp. FT3.2]